jgi:hypothetical protein
LQTLRRAGQTTLPKPIARIYADIEQRIADLNAGAAASQPAAGPDNDSANAAGQNPTDTSDGSTVPVAPVIPSDQNPPSASDNAASPTIGDLMNSPEAKEKRAQAKQFASEAVNLAGGGQYSDVEAIEGLLVQVLGAAQQLSLAGIDDEASELETQAKKALTVFITAFANSCDGQSFDPLFALGLGRQSQLLLNSDGGLTGCENRLLATVSGSGGWRHCGIGIGDWSYRDKFDETSNASGTGTISAEGWANKFSFHVTGPDADGSHGRRTMPLLLFFNPLKYYFFSDSPIRAQISHFSPFLRPRGS